jgi:DNA-binding CsgD family transcriptional regulator
MALTIVPDVSTSEQYRTAPRRSVRGLPPDGVSCPQNASRLRKTERMTNVLPMLNSSMCQNSMLGYESDRTIERFERELAIHRQEEARLRSALARAEALLLERVSPTQGAAETANTRARQALSANCSASLTPRQHEIMKLVLDGHPSKNIAADLGISQRTVENHRAAIMKKTGSKSLPALGRFGFAASRPVMPENAANVFVMAGAISGF